MKFLADEGLEKLVILQLRKEGHEVSWVAELSPSIPDHEVLTLATQNEAVLLTEDKDFGELVYRRGLSHSGVVLVRLDGLSNQAKADIVVEVIDKHGNELVGAFTVVHPESVRIRRTTI